MAEPGGTTSAGPAPLVDRTPLTALRTAMAAEALKVGLTDLADVVEIPLENDIALLVHRPGAPLPILYVDRGTSSEELCRVLYDALQLLTGGPAAATLAQRVRHLHRVK